MHATDESWKSLCEEAANEYDPLRLLELVKEINRQIDEKRARLRTQKVDSQPSNDSNSSLGLSTD